MGRLQRTIEFVDIIVKAWCILYNYARKHDGIKFSDTAYAFPLESLSESAESRTMSAANIEHMYFATYFTHPQGSIPWQHDRI
jgi:hypothetical protein